MGEKRKRIIIILAAAAVVYLVIQYAVPPLLPFLLGYFVCGLLYPYAARVADSRYYPKKLTAGVAFGVIMAFFLLIMGGILFFLMKIGVEQMQALLANWDGYEARFMGAFSDTCRKVDRMAGMKLGTTYYYCCEKIEDLFQNKQGEWAEKIIGLSVPTMKMIGEFAAFLGAMILSAFFFMTEKYRRKKEQTEENRDGDNNTMKREEFFLQGELAAITGRLKEVFGAYLRAQGIIMLITAVICTAGLTIMRNPYSLLIGIIIGALDALPLIGTGLIMIPWIILSFVFGNMRNGVILIITYAVCYAVREFMEPKLIGKHAGISPLVTLISVYVGYKVFGILGVIWGPIAYVVIKEVVELSTAHRRPPFQG